MRVALPVEALKLVRSIVGLVASISVVAGTVLLLTGLTLAVAGGNAEVIAKLGPSASADWPGLLASGAQVTAVGATLGFGVVLAWMFAREFSDGTIIGLFALPIARARIAAAKLAAYTMWATAVSAALTAALFGLGVVFGYGPPDTATWLGLSRQFVLGLLSSAVAAPIAWIATLTRSLLAGVGCAIGLVVIAQVGALAGAGGWMPSAAPALWALSAGHAVGPAQLGLTLIVAAVFDVLTVRAWHRMLLTR